MTDKPTMPKSDTRQKLKEIAGKVFLVIAIGSVAFFPCMFCLGGHTHPLFLDLVTFPWTEWLIKDYLAAVAAGDMASVLELGSPDEYNQEQLRSVAERDIALLKGAEIRNVHVSIGVNIYSDESVVAGYADFEYRLPGDLEWKQGHRTCWSDYSILSKRYLTTCSLEDHRPQ